MLLTKLASFTEESPWWCPIATWFALRPPGPRRSPSWAHGASHEDVELDPQPLPPSPETAALVSQAIRLHRLAQQLATVDAARDVTEQMFRASARLYDECGAVPWQELLSWLRRPPPPPPPWLDLVAHSVSQALIGARLGGDFGRQLQSAAAAVIGEQISAARVN